MIEIGSSIGRYHILEQLGQGGMATVYKAYDTRLEREVAIKVIRTGAFPPDVLERVVKRFEREALSLARLSHPNIVKVYDFGEFNGAPYLVMEYIPGGTIKQFASQPLPWNQVVKLLLPIADALAYSHEEGVLHRDVKPANILLTHKGQPILTDFGIVKLLQEDGGATLTGTGVGVGTPEYMAPEQGLGKPLDGRVDVYSLGIVLCELIIGRKPYTADTPLAVLFKQMTDPLPQPKKAVPDLPDSVEQVILKALAKKPEDRYQSMGDFAAALAKIDTHSIESTASVNISQPPSARPAPAISSEYDGETGKATMDMGETPPVAENIPGKVASPMSQSPLGSVDMPLQRASLNYSEPDGDETGELTSDLAPIVQLAKPMFDPVPSTPEKPAASQIEGKSPFSNDLVIKKSNDSSFEIFHLPQIEETTYKPQPAEKGRRKWEFVAIGTLMLAGVFFTMFGTRALMVIGPVLITFGGVLLAARS